MNSHLKRRAAEEDGEINGNEKKRVNTGAVHLTKQDREEDGPTQVFE